MPQRPAPPQKPKEPKAPVGPRGNVKLIGIAGLVKGEEYSLELGKAITVGRSRECDICLRQVPRARDLADNDEQIQKHFNTVSRVHMRVSYLAHDNVVIEDTSANGVFLDGKRVEGTVVLKDLVDRPHELKLGTHETFRIDWYKLLPKHMVKMVSVKVKGAPKPAEAAEGTEEGKEEGEKADDN